MAQRLRAARFGAIAGLLIAAITGCGAAARHAAQTAVQIDPTFIGGVTAVCVKDNAITAPKGKFPYPQFNPYRPQADLLPKVGAYFKARDIQGISGQLAALGEPARDAGQWDQLRELVDRNTANIVTQTNAALASDRSAFIATLGPAQTLNRQMLTEARQAGFPTQSPCNEAIF